MKIKKINKIMKRKCCSNLLTNTKRIYISIGYVPVEEPVRVFCKSNTNNTHNQKSTDQTQFQHHLDVEKMRRKISEKVVESGRMF